MRLFQAASGRNLALARGGQSQRGRGLLPSSALGPAARTSDTFSTSGQVYSEPSSPESLQLNLVLELSSSHSLQSPTGPWERLSSHGTPTTPTSRSPPPRV